MSELTQVLRHVIPVDDPNVLVGHLTGDDAAVYRIADDRALVVTADFFTPIVDDPYDFGRIAATNALSDVYAMGARPLFALNIVGFPRKLLEHGILDEILRGGNDVARSVGMPVLGGHSIDDAEPKYGLVVVGEVHPARMVTNAAARPGDQLVLTKPLGSGVVATALKRGVATDADIERAIAVMTALNALPARAMTEVGVSAATDVTGFGLLGHLRAMVRASGTSATVRAVDVPLLEGAAELAKGGHVPGGSTRNLEDLRDVVTFADTVDPLLHLLLADAQTSGGMLMAVPADRLDALLGKLEGRTPALAVIGEVGDGPAGTIQVL
jgi:selenide,water dikinase